MSDLFLGLEIGGSKLQLVLGTGDGTIRERRRVPVSRAEGADGIRRQIAAALPDLLALQPAAVGVGFGGPVDHRAGTVCCSHQIAGWSEFPLAAWLRSLTRLPVRVDNDANVGTLGEARCGAGRDANPVFYCTLGSGVGGGLVVDGRIFHGASPGEVEFGHLRLDRSGATVESRCSGWAVDARIRALCRQAAGSVLAGLCGGREGSEARHLGPALAAGDTLAQQVLSDLAEDLGFALSHVTHLLHPQVVVLGGGLGLLGEPLAKAVSAVLPRHVMKAFAPGPRVAAAALREDSIPVGALVLAAEA